MPHWRVLPPGELSGMIPEPLLIYCISCMAGDSCNVYHFSLMLLANKNGYKLQTHDVKDIMTSTGI